MSGDEKSEPGDRLAAVFSLLSRVSTAVGSIIENRAAQVVAIERRELRRAASVFALAFTAAIFSCAAAGFAAVAILAALGEEHRVAGCASLAAGFALLAGVAVLLARDGTAR